jgi:hypothetical protein
MNRTAEPAASSRKARSVRPAEGPGAGVVELGLEQSEQRPEHPALRHEERFDRAAGALAEHDLDEEQRL